MTKKNLRPFWCWNVAGCGSLQNFQQFPRQNITIYIYNIYIYISYIMMPEHMISATWQTTKLTWKDFWSFFQSAFWSKSYQLVGFQTLKNRMRMMHWWMLCIWKRNQGWRFCVLSVSHPHWQTMNGPKDSLVIQLFWQKSWRPHTNTHTQELNYEHGLAPSLHQCSPLPCSLCRDRCQLARVLASPSGFSGGPGHVKPVGTWTCR